MDSITANVNGNYTAAQLIERLTSDGAAVGCRVDVLDQFFNVVTTIDKPKILTAAVSYDTTRPLVGSFGLTILPNEAINIPFLYRLRPWFRIRMLDNGIAEWPMGVYLWNVPRRTDAGRPTEEWQLTLADQCHYLQLTGPGPSGQSAAAGTVVTDLIISILTGLGLSTAGVVPSPTTLTSTLAWALTTSSSTTVTTWLDVLIQLHLLIGYFPPWFDLTGLYRAIPQPDLQTAPIATTYANGQNGTLIVPLVTQGDLTNLANRVTAQGQTVTGLYQAVTVDLNTLSPGHPMSQGSLGFYIDAAISDTVSTTLDQLTATATAELNRRLARFQQLTMSTLMWPVHEAYDVIGVQYTTDAELGGSGISALETAWSADLRAGSMTHTLQRITP